MTSLLTGRAHVVAIRLCLLAALFTIPFAPGTSAQDYFDARQKQALREATDRGSARYLVDVGARLLLPESDTRIAFSAGRAEVYIQFRQALDAAERAALMRQGVRFFGALTRNTYLARVDETGLAALRAHPLFRGIEPVVYADKLTLGLYVGQVRPNVVNADGTWSLIVRFYEDVSLDHALFTLDRLGIQAGSRERMLSNERLFVSATWEDAFALAESHVVRSLQEIPPPKADTNLVAAALSNVDQVQAAPFNLDGDGVVVGQWESGNPDVDHPDLLDGGGAGRINVPDAGAGETGHGTHVAGTIMSLGVGNASSLGMAPSVDRLESHSFNGDTATEHRDAKNDLGIDVANNSWGSTLGWNPNPDGTWTDTGNDGDFGNYDGTARDWDDVVQDTDLIIVKSSGNDGNDCDPADSTDCDGTTGADGVQYDTVGTHGNAKNIITVGAIEDDGVTKIGFSSSGPSDDGRVKPDVVANGRQLLSTCSVAQDGLAYCNRSGTSMSAPTTTGAIALLLQRYRDMYLGATPSAACVKALLVNTAVDLGRPGPDYAFGHGLVDALAAVQTIDVGRVRIFSDVVDDGDENEYLLLVPANSGALRITLDWTDPEGAANSGDPDLINDLDLSVITPSNQILYPFTGPQGSFTGAATATGPNTIDNVEHLRINVPEMGVYRIRVRGSDVPAGPQSFCFVTSHELSLETEPDLVVNAPLDFFETCPDDFQDIEVSLFNTGGAPLFVHDIVLSGSGVFSLLTPPALPFIVLPGSHVDVTVRFAPTAADFVGIHVGTMQIVSNDPDEPLFEVPMTASIGVQDLKTSLEAHGNFGCVKLGEFRTLEYQIINQGTCDLTVTSLTRTAGSVEFTLGEQPGSALFPLTIFPGEHVQVFFKYEPTDFTFDTSAWTLVTDDPDTAERTFQLQGRSMPPDIAVTGSTDFGVVCADELAEKILDICNVGKSDLQVTSVDFVAPCDDFTLINSPYPPAVADDFTPVSHDFCLPVTIRYTPTGVGEHSCVLRIESNDPDEPTVDVLVTGETPPSLIDVPDDLEFPPTVVQAIDATCQSSFPFAVTNIGVCDVQIVDITIEPPAGGDPNYTDYTLENLPEFPLTLQPGHRVGNGQAIVVFRPTAVKRFIKARVAVTYVSNDPEVGDTTTVYVQLCGEGVNTGARLLVTKNGVPIPHVDKITLWAIDDYGEPTQSSYVIEVVLDVWVQQVLDDPPCTGFFFHHEWGGETNPIVLAPGWYRVESAVGTESPPDRTTVFYIPDVCTFLPDVVIDYP